MEYLQSNKCTEGWQEDESREGMEEAEEPQYSALPGHMRHRAAQQALQNEERRTAGELTIENVKGLPAFLEHSFEVPTDHMSFTEAESSNNLAGDEQRKAGKGSRVEFLKGLNMCKQALRRAQRIGLEEAIAEIRAEQEEYFASVRD